jgi:hypothetical protein
MRICLSILFIGGISSVSLAASTPAPKCHVTDKYVVMEQPTASDAVGTNFSIYMKKKATENVKCPLNPKKVTWQIPNENAEYYLGQTGKFLVLDSGTAAQMRDLVIWDLAQRKKINTFRYEAPAQLKDYDLSYWVRSQDKVNATNCPNLNELEKMGLGQAIDYQETLNLKTLQVNKTSKTRCAGVS